MILSKFKPVVTFLFVIVGSFSISKLMRFSISIDPLNPYHQTSTVATGQFFYWVAMFLSCGLMILLAVKQIFRFESLLQLFLIIHLTVETGIILGTSYLALSKTQISFGYWLGDLGVYHELAKEAYLNGMSASGYPTGWTTIVGNFCRIFELDVDYSYKAISLLSFPVFVALTLLIMQYVFPKFLSEVLAIFFVFQFGIFGWKSFGNLTSQLAILGLIKIIFENIDYQDREKIQNKLKLFFYGTLFAVSIWFYYGRAWWISISLAILLIGTVFLKKHRIYIQNSIFVFGLGFLSFGFPFVTHVSNFIKLDFLFLPIFYLIIAYLLFGRVPKKLFDFVSSLSVTCAALIIFYAVITFRTGDSFTGDTGLFIQPLGSVVPKLELVNESNLVYIFLIAIIYISFATRISKVLTLQIHFLVLNIVSSLILMTYFAMRMSTTGKVELWPRAIETIQSTWSLIFVLIAFILIVELTTFAKSKFDLRNPRFLFTLIIPVFLFLYFQSIRLADYQWNLMPRDGTYTNYSYRENPTFR